MSSNPKSSKVCLKGGNNKESGERRQFAQEVDEALGIT